ncbi:MAG: sigma-70 family RNA polymerase sigma factor [Anaerolineales bacterium]|nr:sigma-70 family RNA polymerase sigma factor [Anaerolineales bacterium]
MATTEHEIQGIAPAGSSASAADLHLLAALRSGDEAAFTSLLEQHHASLVRLAAIYVSSRAVAEEVAQETWIGVLQGLDRFEGRSSLKTWIFRILTNRAKTRGQREARSVPFSDLAAAEIEADEPAVDPSRFNPPDDPAWPGHWAVGPQSWDQIPEQQFLSQETKEQIMAAIASLPPSQREVITLRDIEGWSSAEICTVLDLSEANQRVLLHRARSKVRRALELYFGEG